MSRTIEQKKNGDGFPKAGELIEFRSQKELTLQDRRILNLLVEHAGPNIVTEEEHRISMTALRGTHKGGERVRDSIVRLMTTIVEVPAKDSNGERATRRGQFLADTTATDDETDPNGEVRYSFSKTMREVMKRSQYWGRLKAYIICSFQSIDGPWLPKTASEGLSHTPWIAARLCWKQKLWFRQDNGISVSMLIRGFHYELLNARYN